MAGILRSCLAGEHSDRDARSVEEQFLSQLRGYDS